MGTTAQKLAKLQDTKSNIRTSIINKNVSVPADATFASYPEYIDQIVGTEPVGNIEITKQTGTDVSTYATASVVAGNAGTPTGEKSLVSNHSLTVTPSVTNTGGWIDSGTIDGAPVTVSASELTSGTLNLTQSTSTDVTNYKYATVQTGTAGTPTATNSTSKTTHQATITPTVTNETGWITGGTKSGTAVTVSASDLVEGNIQLTQATSTNVANYATATVQTGTAGTPTASAGTVSNNQVTVTPSVTNSTGWITGGTKNGTGFTVKASDLTSGNIQLTQATSTNVANYATATVKSGSISASANKTTSKTTHQATITPSATVSTAGWVSAGATGTAVTVSASELVDGNNALTAGTTTQTGIDVTNYATVSVAPTPSETKTATENGTVTPSTGKLLSSVVVNINYNIYRTGTGVPSSSLGNDGDIYFDLG